MRMFFSGSSHPLNQGYGEFPIDSEIGNGNENENEDGNKNENENTNDDIKENEIIKQDMNEILLCGEKNCKININISPLHNKQLGKNIEDNIVNIENNSHESWTGTCDGSQSQFVRTHILSKKIIYSFCFYIF